MNQMQQNFLSVLHRQPDAIARMEGGRRFPDIRAVVRFYQLRNGVLVSVSARGLPGDCGKCDQSIFGLHIHEGGSCSSDRDAPFSGAQGHFNPDRCPHPQHAGDLPPLFASGDRAFFVVLTDRFQVRDVIGRTVVLHAMPDDLTTQPAGGSGERIACGVIRRR